jgi:membrane-associated phospholipid phosphatase
MARRWYLLTAAACAALAAGLYLLVVHVGLAQRADLDVLERAMSHNTAGRASLATDVVALFDPMPFVLLASAVVAIGVAFRRVRAAAAAALLVAGATLTTEALKPLLAVQRPYPNGHYLGPAAFPSGHTTAVASLLLALVIVVPPRLRPLTAVVSGAGALVAMVSIEMLGYHYPSDVLGGILVASGWAATAVAVTGSGLAPTAARRRPQPRSRLARG